MSGYSLTTLSILCSDHQIKLNVTFHTSKQVQRVLYMKNVYKITVMPLTQLSRRAFRLSWEENHVRPTMDWWIHNKVCNKWNKCWGTTIFSINYFTKLEINSTGKQLGLFSSLFGYVRIQQNVKNHITK